MSLTTTAESIHRERAPTSLAARLTITYAATTCLIVIGAAALMYYQLVASLRHENTSYLLEQVRETRIDLHDALATDSAIRSDVLSNVASQGDAFATYVRILDDHGVIAQSPNMETLAPTSLFKMMPMNEQGISKTPVVRTPGGQNQQFQLISANAPGFADLRLFQIQIALDLSEEDRLLAQYRTRILLILLPALLISIAASYLLAHNGLRPLRQVSRAIRRVESTTLDRRIASEKFPGELARLATSFNDMLQRIEEGFTRLSRFSADIAHELRTPLGVIRGELEIALAKSRSPAEYQDVMASCLEECLRLSHLIDRMLFLARAEREEAVLRREMLDLHKELDNLREFYEPIAAEGGIRLEFNVPNSLQVTLDRTLLQSAVGNVLENAVRHTAEHGTVALTARQDDAVVYIEVRDTGCGIAPEHLPFVTDRFYRADNSRSRTGNHAGLGLALVKSIAALHGGELCIESALGRGTQVVLKFPNCTGDKTALAPALPRGTGRGA